MGAVVLLAIAILLFVNTNPGRSAVASLLGPVLGGNISVQGLSGRIPVAPTAEHVEISDDHGVWLKLDHVSVYWSPLQLLRNRISAHSVTAESATLLRWPVPGTSEGSSPPMDFKRVTIGRLVIGPAIASRTVVVSLSGTAYYTSASEFSGVLHMRRLDAPGDYEVRGRLQNSDLSGTATIREPGDGLVAGILDLPGLGPLAVGAHASGPRNENHIDGVVTAGPLHASMSGTIDLLRRSGAVSFDAASPAANLRPGLGWQSLVLKGEMRGAFVAPDISSHFLVRGFRADGGSVQSLTADVHGRHGNLHLTGAAVTLRVPGTHPDLFAASPMTFDADARLNASRRNVDLTLNHPLLALSGHLIADGNTGQAALALKFPQLSPLAAAEGIDAHGSVDLNAIVTVQSPQSSVAVNGALRLDGGSSGPVQVLGTEARVAGLITMRSGDMDIDQAALESAGASAMVTGKWRNGKWDVSWSAALKDLRRLFATLKGRIAMQGTVSGSDRGIAVTASGNGAVATKGYDSGPLRIALRVQGLPLAPSGIVDISGKLDGSPLILAAKLSRSAKAGWQLGLNKADWKSVHARGSLIASAGRASPSGRMELHVGRLADIQPLLGHAIGGKLDGVADFQSAGKHQQSHIVLTAENLGYGDVKIGIFRLAGELQNPLTKPLASLTYAASNFAADNVGGTLDGTVNGTRDALAVTLVSKLHVANGQIVQIAGAATADIPKSVLTLSSYDVHAAGQFVHLQGPARFDLSNGIAVDSLRLAADQSEVDFVGRFTPELDATVNMHNITGKLLMPFLPGYSTQGLMSGTAKLSGTLAAPLGTVSLTGKGLQIGLEGAADIPPADLAVTAVLQRTKMALHATVRSGTKIQLDLTGDVPLRPNGAVNLRASGSENLAILDPVLNAAGRSLHGILALDATITGTFSRPRVSGSGTLSSGEFQDYVRGIHISAISASLEARGDNIAINNFSARAGDGTITGGGTIDLASPGEPVSLSVVAKNAKPISNDVLNATLDANLKLAGRLAQQFTLSGNVNVRRGEIDIPDSLPSGVVVLALRGKGRPPPPPPIAMSLDLNLQSNGLLFVRGHGVDAEMSGKVHVGGTTLAPDVTGGFDLRRGNLSLAGQTLDFTSGRVSFDGSSLRERIDPSLDLVAQTMAAGTSATLTVSGHASTPKVALSSTPPLPQDEVLAHLLFGQSTTQLSPWQIAQLGQALASLGGMGGLGDPLSRVRKSLGLDRLAVTTAGATGTETAVEAGRYVAHNIYVGAKQGVSGSGGTQAVVQVDLTKHLKLQTQISSDNSPTPVSPGTTPVDTGSNLGLSYQFEY
jgi:translocation and assembly module TamB